MKLRPHILLPLVALSGALTASAQHQEYITEAPVTFEITFGTHVRAAGSDASQFTTKPVTSRLNNSSILEQLKNGGILPADAVTSQWSFIAARAAIPDRNYIDGNFYLYAVNADRTQKVYLGQSGAGIFQMLTPVDPASGYSYFNGVLNYTESHQGQNVISSAGTATTYDILRFTPSFSTLPRRSPTAVVGANRVYTETSETYTLDSLETPGFSTINFATRVSQPVFFLAINTHRFTAVGDFTGHAEQKVVTYTQPLSPANSEVTPTTEINPNPTDVPAFGLVSMRVTVGSAKLVLQSDFPEVPY